MPSTRFTTQARCELLPADVRRRCRCGKSGEGWLSPDNIPLLFFSLSSSPLGESASSSADLRGWHQRTADHGDGVSLASRHTHQRNKLNAHSGCQKTCGVRNFYHRHFALSLRALLYACQIQFASISLFAGTGCLSSTPVAVC